MPSVASTKRWRIRGGKRRPSLFDVPSLSLSLSWSNSLPHFLLCLSNTNFSSTEICQAVNAYLPPAT